METQSSWERFIAQTKVLDVLPRTRSFVRLEHDQSFSSALRTLLAHNILSAPVLDSSKMGYVGFVDVLDLLMYAITKIPESVLVETGLTEAVESERALNSTTIAKLSDFSARNPWCPVNCDSSLRLLIDLFSPKLNIHRVPVVNNDGAVLGVVTQSTLASFLFEHIHCLPKDVLRAPLGDWALKRVISVKNQHRTIDAYIMLLDNKVSAVAVVDDAGKLTGVLSASDLKGCLPEDIFRHLQLPVEEFLTKSRKRIVEAQRRAAVESTHVQGVDETTIEGLKAPLSVRIGQDTVEGALAKLVGCSVHRVFVVDEDNRPIGVVSFSDLIGLFKHK